MRVLGLFFVQLHFLVNTILASGWRRQPERANYAWLLMLLPLGVFAQAIGTAAFPTRARSQPGSPRPCAPPSASCCA